MSLPEDSKSRKDMPIVSGVLDFFPDAIAYVSKVSKYGSEKHNPGEPLRWSREKSNDHADCIGRHLIQRGTFDKDGFRHSGMLAWRALANLQLEIERDAEIAKIAISTDLQRSSHALSLSTPVPPPGPVVPVSSTGETQRIPSEAEVLTEPE
jgi:hypothetical protein